MDSAVLKDISRRIRGLGIRRMKGRLSRYVKLSASFAKSLEQPDPGRDKAAPRLDACWNDLSEQIPALLDRLTDARICVGDLRYKENGMRNGSPQCWEQARQCFKVLKEHEMELLALMSDEVGIVWDALRQCEQIRWIILSHAKPMRRAATLLDILLERFAFRPTAEALRIQTLGPLDMAVQDALNDLEQRSRTIAKAEVDLKEGWRVLHRLSAKGCSRRILKKAKKLSIQHEARRQAFQQRIWDGRDCDSFS